MFEIYDGRLAFYQWDVEQKVVLDTTPSFDFQVHLRDSSSDVCLVTEPYELDGKIVADVPDILLQSGEPITLWCYVMGDDDEHTIACGCNATNGGTIEYTPTLTATTESKTSNYGRCVRI